MSYLQFRFRDYAFKPTLFGTLVTVCCIPIFIKLGLWQYSKAEQKQALQSLYDTYDHAIPVDLPTLIASPDDWRYKRVRITGTYQPKYQILLDNQIEKERVGYHVITPLHIKNSDVYVLVNRGWVPAEPNHSDLPLIATPESEQTVIGQVWVPGSKFYSLEKPEQRVNTDWQPVWQNMDMKRYQASVPLKVQPVVVRMSPDSDAAGFARNWPRPDERITTHIGYAYQWFGFSVAAVIIYFVVSFKKMNNKKG